MGAPASSTMTPETITPVGQVGWRGRLDSAAGERRTVWIENAPLPGRPLVEDDFYARRRNDRVDGSGRSGGQAGSRLRPYRRR